MMPIHQKCEVWLIDIHDTIQSSSALLTHDLTPQLDFIQMICLKRREVSEERGKRDEIAVVFGCWHETRMLENSVA